MNDLLRDVLVAILLGVASGGLAVLTLRLRLAWLGCLVLARLSVAVYVSSPLGTDLGAVFGVLAYAPTMWGWYPRAFEVIINGAVPVSAGAVLARSPFARGAV